MAMKYITGAIIMGIAGIAEAGMGPSGHVSTHAGPLTAEEKVRLREYSKKNPYFFGCCQGDSECTRNSTESAIVYADPDRLRMWLKVGKAKADIDPIYLFEDSRHFVDLGTYERDRVFGVARVCAIRRLFAVNSRSTVQEEDKCATGYTEEYRSGTMQPTIGSSNLIWFVSDGPAEVRRIVGNLKWNSIFEEISLSPNRRAADYLGFDRAYYEGKHSSCNYAK